MEMDNPESTIVIPLGLLHATSQLCYMPCRNTLAELRVQAADCRKAQGWLRLFGWLYWGIMGGFSYGNRAVQKMEAVVAKSKKVRHSEFLLGCLRQLRRGSCRIVVEIITLYLVQMGRF